MKYEKLSCNFDSIGQRSETLRARLESIEFSFRDIEAIRTQFHDALTSIDQTLVEIHAPPFRDHMKSPIYLTAL